MVNTARKVYRPTKSGAKATAVQTLREIRWAQPNREAFGLRRVHRRFSNGAANRLTVQFGPAAAAG